MNDHAKPWTRWLLTVQGILLILMLIGMAGHKFELLPFKPAFSGVLLALALAFVTAIISLLALLWSWLKRASHWRPHAIWAAVVGLMPLLIILTMVGPKNLSVPPIHDITTDMGSPPLFVVAQSHRIAGQNPLDYPGQAVAEQQRQAYPDIEPLLSELRPSEAFTRSAEAVRQLGWFILDENPTDGRIEATEETALFGFKDDIVIRVTANGDGSRIDTRSVSRVGKSDLGANAARILRFQQAFLHNSH